MLLKKRFVSVRLDDEFCGGKRAALQNKNSWWELPTTMFCRLKIYFCKNIFELVGLAYTDAPTDKFKLRSCARGNSTCSASLLS